MNITRTCLASLGVVALVSLAACGDDEATPTSTTAAAAPETTGAAAQTTAAAPETTESKSSSDDGYGPGQTGSTTGGSASETTASAGDGEAVVATAETDLGTILVDATGRTLYAFTPDTEGVPTCIDDCADNWPPAFVEGEIAVGDLDASVFTLVEHPGGGQQLKAGDFPLYLFAGDSAPGDVNGQGVGGNWWVVTPDGTLIES